MISLPKVNFLWGTDNLTFGNISDDSFPRMFLQTIRNETKGTTYLKYKEDHYSSNDKNHQNLIQNLNTLPIKKINISENNGIKILKITFDIADS